VSKGNEDCGTRSARTTSGRNFEKNVFFFFQAKKCGINILSQNCVENVEFFLGGTILDHLFFWLISNVYFFLSVADAVYFSQAQNAFLEIKNRRSSPTTPCIFGSDMCI
jgi:hypothetical protein